MVSKKILGVAIAAAMSAPAFAAIDMTAGTGGAGTGAIVIAKETILNGNISSGLIQFNPTTAPTLLDTTADLGFGVSAGSHAFVRYDLTNAKFRAAVVAGDLTLPGQTINTNYIVTVAQGGAVGDTYVIFDVTAVTAQTQAQDLLLDLGSGLALTGTDPVSISYAHYSTSPAAVAKTGALASDSYQAITVANALTTTITGTNREANVSATPVFTQFVSPAAATAVLGNVKFVLNDSAVKVDGTAVAALSDVIDNASGKSQVVITGDLAFTVGTVSAANTAANVKLAAVNSDTASTNVASGKFTNLSAGIALGTVGTPGAGNDISFTAVTAMNNGSYSVTFTPTALAGAAYPLSAVTGAIGTITRSGTTIQVPYVTTFADYNQRLVLVNRYSAAAPYSITFTEENGVTAAAGAKATGTLAANETLILKATDIVTLTGSTRTAATVVVTAPAGTIDAATTSVNLSDKSTDTVKLN